MNRNLMGVAIAIASLVAAPADAQEIAQPPSSAQSTGETPATRAEALKRVREQKARATVPAKAGRLEKLVVKVENDRLIEDLLTTGQGFYVQFGNVTTGAGLGAGPGYKRRNLFEGLLDVKVSTVVTMKKYWVAEGSVAMPRLANGRAFVELHVRRRDFPQEDFFGLGPDSRRADFVSYTYRDTAGGLTVGARVLPLLTLSGLVERLSPSVGRGRDSSIPTLDTIFTEADAPGYTVQSDFMHYDVVTDLNYATPFGNPRDGGRYIFTFSRYVDIENDLYSFNRFDVDLRQYISFLQSRRVFALRAFISMSDADSSGDVVPFYMMHTLGGHNTLRGFRNYRFRDQNVLLLQAEYRWEIFPALDAALFYDAGKVAPTERGLTLENLKSDYGFGFRFGTNAGVFLRVDAAFGSAEGKRYFIKFGNVF